MVGATVEGAGQGDTSSSMASMKLNQYQTVRFALTSAFCVAYSQANSLRRCRVRIWSFVCFTFLLAFLAAPAWPQASTANVRGTVRDQTAAVIPNASVALANTNTYITTRTTTNEAGSYLFPGR